MTTFFLVCAALGAAVLVLQTVAGLLGAEHHGPDAGVHEGLDLLGVRALAAAVAFYGLGGVMALSFGWPGPLAALFGVLPGAAALVATSFLMRQVVRMDSDGSLRIEGAVGTAGTVYLTIPGREGGPGKVQLALQGRTVELQAVSREERPIPTGAPVIVVSVVDADTVEVVPTSSIGEILDGHR